MTLGIDQTGGCAGVDLLDGRPLHFLGITGRGQTPLALVADAFGAPVTGCDNQPHAERVRLLLRAGIGFHSQHDVAHLPDGCTVVATGAVPAHPELMAAEAFVRRSDLLRQVLRRRPGVGVSGSHGKGTVAALLACGLRTAGLDPLAVIGTEVPAWEGGPVLLGDGPTVAEVDDSDLSVADVDTRVAVVTNLDEDHIYQAHGLRDALAALGSFVARAEERVVLGPGPRQGALAAYAEVPAWRYGRDFAARVLRRHAGRTDIVLHGPGGEREEVSMALLGPRIEQNAALAFAAGLAIAAEPAALAEGIGMLDRLSRRLEPVGKAGGVRIFDDFGGKHPVAVRVGLQTLRRHYPNARIVAAFEPYGGYLARWGSRYARALSYADRVVAAPAFESSSFPHAAAEGAAWWQRCTVPVDVAETREQVVPLAMRGLGAGDVLVVFAQRFEGGEYAQTALESA